MFNSADIAAGLADAFTLYNLMFVLMGVALGQFVGAIPGLSAPMAIAIAVPFTFVLSPLTAIAFLVGVGKGGTVGGAIPAVLINTPGSPEAAATALDGYPMAQKGQALKAMKMSLFSSVTGDTMSDLVLITVAAPLALVALKMGPVEIVCLMMLAFAIITGLVGDSMAKGLMATAFGLLCASVGLDPEHGTSRLQFGYFELDEGLPLAAVGIGVLAVGEIIRQLVSGKLNQGSAITLSSSQNSADRRVSFAEYWSCRYTMLRAGAIGTVVGAMPGIGATAAAFLSYGYTKSASKDPDSFGKGNIHGVAATEAANSAVMGANLIPLLTLGIPGNVTAAMIIGALIIHGIQPGPLLFKEQGRLIYGLFGAMMMANVLNLLLGQIGLRFWAIVATAPGSLIFSVALLLCVTGVYLTTGGLFGVAVMIVFAALGYLMRVFGFSIVAFIIAFVLGKQFELSLAQAMIITNGDIYALRDHPVAIALILLSVLCVYWLGFRKPQREKAGRKAAPRDTDSTTYP
ncbi:MAG: tripartite tricarboxylate transporter permease [Hyphomicrobiales bacterium]|nr:tripartite tricarboxylate transporter permease [Hyphomicrobiales bacterium]